VCVCRMISAQATASQYHDRIEAGLRIARLNNTVSWLTATRRHTGCRHCTQEGSHTFSTRRVRTVLW
jgi:hypothetical protein